MIKIDGSYGEGGGQILRTSVALAALTMKPVEITNIRANRPKPGLKKQHMAGIQLTGRLVDAEISGLYEGSTKIVFRPRSRKGGRFEYNVGTAGAISLVLQAVIPAAILAPEKVVLQIEGGTDVAWSPPIDYMRNVFAPTVSKMGLHIKIEQVRRGHYPRGGGLVTCEIEQVKRLNPINVEQFGTLEYIRGISHCVRLPAHVAERQARAAESVLRENGMDNVDISVEHYPREHDPHRGPGSGIVLWAMSSTGNILGADALGTKGKRAEQVGSEAAHSLVRALSTGLAVDAHLSDMLVPYMALASGDNTIGITEVTSHLETNIWVSNKFLKTKMELVKREDGTGILYVRGLGSEVLS